MQLSLSSPFFLSVPLPNRVDNLSGPGFTCCDWCSRISDTSVSRSTALACASVSTNDAGRFCGSGTERKTSRRPRARHADALPPRAHRMRRQAGDLYDAVKAERLIRNLARRLERPASRRRGFDD